MRVLRSRYARRVFVPFMAVSVLSACSKWEVQDIEPAQLVLEKGLVRLTMLNGDKIQVADPTVSDGKIVGHSVRYARANTTAIRSDTLRVPIDSVAKIEIRKANPKGTEGLIVATLTLLGAAALVFAMALSSLSPPF